MQLKCKQSTARNGRKSLRARARQTAKKNCGKRIKSHTQSHLMRWWQSVMQMKLLESSLVSGHALYSPSQVPCPTLCTTNLMRALSSKLIYKLKYPFEVWGRTIRSCLNLKMCQKILNQSSYARSMNCRRKRCWLTNSLRCSKVGDFSLRTTRRSSSCASTANSGSP